MKPRLEFILICLRYHLHQSHPKSGPAKALIRDLKSLAEKQKVEFKEPTKIDDLFLKGLFDLSKTFLGEDLRWFEFKEELGSRDKLLGRWKKNLKREQRYEIYVQAAQSLGRLKSSVSMTVLGEFQHGLGLEPEECDRLRRGKHGSHRLVKASVYRLLTAEAGESIARAFVTKRFHLTPTPPQLLLETMQAKTRPLIRRLSSDLVIYLSKSHLTPEEKANFLKLSLKIKNSGQLDKLDDASVMILLRPLLVKRSNLRYHSLILQELRSWLKRPLPEVTDLAANLNLFLPIFGEKPLMDRKLADVLERLYGKRRPHFPDPGEEFRRDYYVFLQFTIAKTGADLKLFAANVIRSVPSPLESSPEEFCYDLLKNYVHFHQRKDQAYLSLEMSRPAEKEFFDILRELKISRGSVIKALQLLMVHHHIHLKLPSSQICVPG